METKKLYYDNCYDTSFTSVVLECIEKNNQYLVVLAQTLFYPEGGGQSADKGMLDGQAVLDVQQKEGVIYHTLAKPLELSKTVEGTIDWAYRFDLMRNHTAEHILSGFVHSKWGYDNVGFHMGADVITLDFNGKLSNEEVNALEIFANQKAALNEEVIVCYPDKNELEKMNYRSKKALTGDVRIVEVPEADICACCGLHVARTGEIGLVKILSVQSYKGGVRLSMIAGERALLDYAEKSNQLQQISVCLSAPQNKSAKAVLALRDERDALRLKLNQCQKELFQCKLAALPSNSEYALFFESAIDSKQLKNITNMALQKVEHFAAIFSSDDKNGFSFMIASKQSDAQDIFKRMQSVLDCKAGGSKDFVQGKAFASEQAITEFFNEISKP